MPYIPWEDRPVIDAALEKLELHNVGEVNYAITRLLIKYLGFAPTYAMYNATVGVLECVKLEMYRRAIAPYEDMKKGNNGDVY